MTSDTPSALHTQHVQTPHQANTGGTSKRLKRLCIGACSAGSPAARTPLDAFMTSARLWYRAPRTADSPLLTVLRNDPRVRRNTRPRFPVTDAAVGEWMKSQNPWVHGNVNDHATFVFGRSGTSTPIGITALFAINWIDRNAEFGITIDVNQWSQGFGREVAIRMVEYGFAELNLHRIELNVVEDNIAGIKAYRAAGFVLEGTRRQSSFVDGCLRNTHIMSVLRDEWPSREENAETRT